jgi:CheY-like chemotaxis protein
VDGAFPFSFFRQNLFLLDLQFWAVAPIASNGSRDLCRRKEPSVPEQATILVVDDEIGPRESLRAILKSEYRVLVATEGEQAIKMVDESSIDVVLLDLRMPGVTGMQVMERIKAKDPDIEVVLITGYASYETVLEALRLHAFDYIPKPFNIAQLRDLVRRAVARRSVCAGKSTPEKEPITVQPTPKLSGNGIPVDVVAMQKELEGIRTALTQQVQGALHVLEEGSQELATQYAARLDARGREVVQRLQSVASNLTRNLTEVLSPGMKPLPTWSASSSTLSAASV